MLKNWLFPLAVATAFLTAPARALDVTILQVDGDDVHGELKAIDAEGATVGDKAYSSKNITQIKFPGQPEKVGFTSPTVILRNQDAICQAALLSGGDTKLTLKSHWLKEFALEYKAVDAIVFYATGKKMPDAVDGLLKAEPPKEDLLVTLKGESISGFYEKLSDKDVSFNAGGQSRAYPFDQIAAVRFAVTEPFEPNKALNAILQLVDGSRISAKLAGIDGNSVSVEAVGGNAWPIAGNGICSVEYSGGRMVYLSALTPKLVDQKPYVGGAPFVFTWRKDHSAGNGPLKIGDTTYEKGIGMHSYCRLVYELNGAYVKFLADAGMDATAPAKASCAWSVRLDGKDGASGTAAAGAKTAVKLDVTGVKTLELICDFGSDADDSGDRLDFGRARLIKP